MSQPISQAYVEQRTIHGEKRLASVGEKILSHVFSKAGNGRVGAQRLLEVVRQGRAQKPLRQEYPEQEHAPAPQSACMLE